jgi:pentose-5-phosphate-3-epimerase
VDVGAADAERGDPDQHLVAGGHRQEACAEALALVDGLLVMLIDPGTTEQSDPALLTKVTRARATLPVGVDGGVGEANLGAVLAAGATYVVIGRRLFPITKQPSE